MILIPYYTLLLLSNEKIKAVIHPDIRITTKSIGAKTMPGKLSKIKPEPKLYKCPLSRNISAICIRKVITAAEIAGIQIDKSFRLPIRNEPRNTPTVTPSRVKKKVIKEADRGET